MNFLLPFARFCQSKSLSFLCIRFGLILICLFTSHMGVRRLVFRTNSILDCEGIVESFRYTRMRAGRNAVSMAWPVFKLTGHCAGQEYTFDPEESYPTGFFQSWVGDPDLMQMHSDGTWHVKNSFDSWLPFQWMIFWLFGGLLVFILFIIWLDSVPDSATPE